MPEKQTIERVRRDAAEGKSASTQAGEFIREQIHHIRRGVHGARSARQAIAIGLSEARRAGVKLPSPNPKNTSGATRRKAALDRAHANRPVSHQRSQATLKALKREPHATVSKSALSRQTRQAARRRSAGERSAAARKAAATRRKIAGNPMVE